MSYSIKRSMYTESSHYLKNHPGKCQFLHGHSYKWTVEIACEELRNEMVIDFGDLKVYMENVIEPFDHALVLQKTDLQSMQHAIPNERFVTTPSRPTAEIMAKMVYDELASMLPKRLDLISVTCRETRNNEATYREEQEY